MSITTETELKTMLSETVATQILATYAFAPSFTQTNTYFDTPDDALKNASSALRIRNFTDHAEQTLKVRAAGAERKITEFTDPLTTDDAQKLLDENRIAPGGTVYTQLSKLAVPVAKLRAFATITTERHQCQLSEGLLVIDHSHFHDGTSDWELEIEYHNRAAATTRLAQLQAQFGFQLVHSENKIARAIAHMS